MLRRTLLKIAPALGAAAAPVGAAFAKDAPVYTGTFSNVAVGGVDPVAYFTEGRPVKGDRQFTLKHQGAEWRFASAANRDAFAAAPEKYAPQYGGYCALGTANGYKVSTQPDAFKVVDGKLYLNHDRKVLELWTKDEPGYIERADQNWPDVAKQPLKQ